MKSVNTNNAKICWQLLPGIWLHNGNYAGSFLESFALIQFMCFTRMPSVVQSCAYQLRNKFNENSQVNFDWIVALMYQHTVFLFLIHSCLQGSNNLGHALTQDSISIGRARRRLLTFRIEDLFVQNENKMSSWIIRRRKMSYVA